MNEIVKLLPKMKTGDELMEAMGEYPAYDLSIREKDTAQRLAALSDIYDIYIPSQMSAEIYHKLYLGLMRSLQKKSGRKAVLQQNENAKGIRSQRGHGIIGGSDSFTIIGASGIGKSSAVYRSLGLITEQEVIEIPKPFCRIAPCVVVQCPFDSSVKGLLLEILRKVDVVLDSRYYENAVRARATTDMLIGSVSQIALNHIGLLIVDEIQNVANSKNGKSLVGMLTQLINNSGISICMVGTPESIPFFEQAMQLARRSLGLQYGVMGFNEEFARICRVIFSYQYTKKAIELTDKVQEWLYGHSGGNISVLVALIHDAQEIAILEGRDILDMEALEKAYKKRITMLHDYLGTFSETKKQCSERKKKGNALEVICEMERQQCNRPDVCKGETESGNVRSLSELVMEAKNGNGDIVELIRHHFALEEVAV